MCWWSLLRTLQNLSRCVCVHVCWSLLIDRIRCLLPQWVVRLTSGRQGRGLVTQHKCTIFVCLQFLTVKEVIKGEIQPLDQLPHCHDVECIIKVCIHACVACMCVCVCVRACVCVHLCSSLWQFLACEETIPFNLTSTSSSLPFPPIPTYFAPFLLPPSPSFSIHLLTHPFAPPLPECSITRCQSQR